MTLRAVALVLTATAGATLLAGCGANGDRPELGEVTGTITFNGEPLANAQIAFRPTSGGRYSSGATDENGQYRLLYILMPEEVWGAKLGEHMVIVSTFLPEDEPGGPQPERMPECYRGRDTSLKAVVEEGDNVIDFNLSDDCAT